MDSYDSLSAKYPSNHTQLEYWTNGTVTHLMASQEAAAVSIAHAPLPLDMSARPHVVSRANTVPNNNNINTDATNKSLVRNSLIAGTFAGVTSTCSVYPLDVLRTKMQSAAAVSLESTQQTSKSPLAVSASVQHHHHHHYRGPLQVFLQTLQHGGIRALYTGMALPVAAQAVFKAAVFSVNKLTTSALLEWKRQELQKIGLSFSTPTLSLGDRFICGSVGGAVNAFLFVTPVEFVRNQLIAQLHTRKGADGIICLGAPHYNGPGHVIRHTLSSTQGISGLWKGAAMTVSRDSLGCGCFFYTFYLVKHYLPNDDTWSTALAGAISGLGFWVAALPLDTVKTWVQNGSARSGTEAIIHSLSQVGVMGTATRLTRGWQVAFGRGMPAAAMTMVTYEAASNYLDHHY
jgi:hypothetical protein